MSVSGVSGVEGNFHESGAYHSGIKATWVEETGHGPAVGDLPPTGEASSAQPIAAQQRTDGGSRQGRGV
jgi:hypothetical protein